MSDMTQVLQDSVQVGSYTETMTLFVACIVLLVVFLVWYEFFADRDNSHSKINKDIKYKANEIAKRTK